MMLPVIVQILVLCVMAQDTLEGSECPSPQVIDGYTYCQAVDRAVFYNVGHGGTYDKVTNMDSITGKVDSVPFSYSGPLAPLDEDISLHFRGPLNLKQFAVYNPPSILKRSVQRRRIKYVTEIEVVEINEKVIVETTIGGNATTYTKSATVTSGKTQTPVTDSHNFQQNIPKEKPASMKETSRLNELPPLPSVVSKRPDALGSPSTTKPSLSASTPASSVDRWQRTGYYNRDSRVVDGILFLNNRGGQGSGVWDYKFGNSLSYADSTGVTAASGPSIFSGELKDSTEISIFSNVSCVNADCGYSRPGGVNYYGFSGASKLFLLEYEMPGDSDMPAIWFLNAQIPRVGQYIPGNCWASGCGELDVFEILSKGNDKLIPTLHATNGGGFNNYFVRPVNGYIKAAILMDENSVVIQILPSAFEFDTSLSAETIAKMHSSFDTASERTTSLKLVLH